MEKNHYKEYPKQCIGASDGASLTVRFPDSARMLHFGEDGVYHAYVVDENAEIGEHYKLLYAGRHWVRIYDDASLSFEAVADSILVYVAGAKGCVIQLINPTSVNGEDLKIFTEDIYYGLE
ncbi:MAG: hypothetical protein IJP16_05080 [Clostridia bacterium]|nr:hypothetical protein [Clostridia bacterium]